MATLECQHETRDGPVYAKAEEQSQIEPVFWRGPWLVIKEAYLHTWQNIRVD